MGKPGGRRPSGDSTDLWGASQPPPPLPLFGDVNPPSRTPERYWRLFNDLGQIPPPLNLEIPAVTPEAFQGLTNQVQSIAVMLRAIIPYISWLAQQPSSQSQAASLTQEGAMLSLKEQPPATQLVDDLPRFPLEFDHAPSGDAARRPTPTPSTSVHSLPDLDTLSSDSTDSLRAQLRLMNQKIDDVHKTIRMKDVARVPFVALPLSKKSKIHPSRSTSASRR
ncbi:hypothetical protein GW17_00055272 [Ensete ventricosum]|nr:hypothetical protein GW17_00055272 [Ensete ventricosum]